MVIPTPTILTVKTLRDYLDAFEASWTTRETKVLGEFENHKVFHLGDDGLDNAAIEYDGTLGFIITSTGNT